MRRIFEVIFRQAEKKSTVKLDRQTQEFLKVAQEQLRELSRKGLGISVFTL